jgi:autotransporter-associated beta strand protein
LTGVGSIVKSGSGTLSITSSGSNYTGSTTVSAGNLLVSGLLSGTTGLNVNGGSFSLGSSNRVNDAAAVSFGGGTLATAGFSETMGTATVAANSTLDLGSGASVVQFGDSSTATWTGGALLSITHWDGITAGGGTDQVYFGTSNAALTASQIAAIQFIDPAGFAPGTYSSQILPTGEVVPAPEPATASLLAATGLLLGLRRRRR